MSRTVRPLRAAAALLVTGLLIAAAARPARGQEETPAAGFGEVLDVELVSVEVWVTDPAGNPVVGLTAEDFAVFEDGDPVPIRYFAEVRSDPDGPGPASVGSGVPPPETAPAPTDTPAWLVVYLDELHLSAGGREELVATLGRFLPYGTVPPERVMILRQGEGLRAAASFGSSRAELERSLRRLAEPLGSGLGREHEKRLAIDRLQSLWVRAREEPFVGPDPCVRFTLLAAREIEPYARQAQERTATTLDHLEALVGMLGAVPGVKTVVYLSDALETSPGADLLRFVDDLCPLGQRELTVPSLGADLARGLRLLARYASANRVTIHSLQPSGLRTLSLTGPEQRAFSASSVQGLQGAVRQNEREGLLYLARETGGRAVFNENDLSDALSRIGRDLGSYYTLAYEPPSPGGGGEHRIEVRVRGGDLRARHRQGYRAPGPAERTRERMQAALYLGLVGNGLGARLGAGEVPAAARGERVSVPLHVLVPSGSLAFLPTARVAVQAEAYDDRGRREATAAASVSVARPEADDAVVSLLTPLDLPAGRFTLVVAVSDETTGEESVLSTEITVPEKPGE